MPSDINPTNLDLFFFPSFFFSFTEIFTLALLRPEIGCRAIHHARNSAERGRRIPQEWPLACASRRHTRTHSAFCGILYTCMGMGMLPPKKPPPEERACGCGSLLPRRPNPSCTHAFLLRRCFLVVDAGSSNLRRKNCRGKKQPRDETEMEKARGVLSKRRAGTSSFS